MFSLYEETLSDICCYVPSRGFQHHRIIAPNNVKKIIFLANDLSINVLKQQKNVNTKGFKYEESIYISTDQLSVDKAKYFNEKQYQIEMWNTGNEHIRSWISLDRILYI